MKTIAAAIVLATFTLSLGACANDANKVEAKATTINATCPYSGGANDPAIHSTFEGKEVGFCCNGCKSKFDAASADGKRAVLAKAKIK